MRHLIGMALALFVTTGLVGNVAAQSNPTSSATVFRLQPGDAVRITVWRQPELSGEFAVTAEGFIAHPLYRHIRVVGLPLATIEAQLAEFLASYVENPRFVIEPMIHVTVGGAVARPNVYSVRPGTSILEVMALAGGVTERGNQDALRLTREGVQRRIDLDDQGRSRMPVQSGDELFVATRSQWFRNVLLPVATITGAIASLVIAIRRD